MSEKTDVTTIRGDEPGRGREASGPSEIPPKGWKDIFARTRVELKQDRVSTLAAAVAFYSLLALVPAMIALVSIYGLVADPSTIDRQMRDWLGAAPQEVRELLVAQLQQITERTGATVGLGVALGVAFALWSASAGMAHLVDALNVAYDEEETRGFVRRRGLALLLTLGAIVFMLFAVLAITVLPAVLADTGLGTSARVVVNVVRWVVLLVGMLLALGVLYRFAPDRDDARWRWVSPGALVATGVWLLASALFAMYTANFASYNETYGSLGAVVILMLWLFITAGCVILGAELNAEIERQTRRDSTVGSPQPIGSRDAEVADTVGATADEIDTRAERRESR